MNITQMIVIKKSKTVFSLLLIISCWFGIQVLPSGCSSIEDKQVETASPKIKVADTLSYLKKIDSITGFLQTGDLVFRMGNDFASQTFANMNKSDKRFSHVGMISMKSGKPMVYHCLGGEFNPDQKMLLEPLRPFLSPEANSAFGIYRIKETPPQKLILKILDSLYISGVRFDLKFDLKTDDRLYCSEMLYKILRKIAPHLSLKIAEAGGVSYVSTETFTQSPGMKPLIYAKLN